MPQDSSQTVIFKVQNCDCKCNSKQFITETGYGTNQIDVQNTKEICNTVWNISLLVVGVIIIATVSSQFKSFFESKSRKKLDKLKEAKEQELDKLKEEKEAKEQELQNQVNALKTENGKLKEWESRFEDLEKRLKQIEEK